MQAYSCIFLMLRLILTVTAINHWVLKDNVIVPKPETPFLMREPQNFIAFIKQIRNSEFVENSYIQLLRQREQIVENLQFSVQFGKELIEQAKCAMEFFLIEKRSSYLKISTEYLERIALPKLKKYKDHYLSSSEEPICEEYAPYMASCFDTAPNTRQAEMIERMILDPEENMTLGEVRIDADTLRRQAMELLQEEPESWKSHLIASFYWRHRGNAKKAIACACRAMVMGTDPKIKDIPLLNLGIILVRAGSLEDAEILLSAAVEADPKIAQNHLVLGATLALKHDFNRSLEHLEEAERIDAGLLPKTVPLRKFISCFDNLGKKTTKMNSYVEYIKNEVREFKSLKLQIKRRHEALMDQQVPLNARQLHESASNKDLLKRGQYCSTRMVSSSKEPVLYCDFYTDMQMRLESKEVDITVLEREIKTSSESVLKQVTKELGKEISFHEMRTQKVPLFRRIEEQSNGHENKKTTWRS